jgi:hypothetical protein
MRLMKSLGVLGALLPIVYCGGLLFYFAGFGKETKTLEAGGLGSTILGLGVVGLLFCIPLVFKIAKLFARSRAGGGPDAPSGGLDPDAMIARYMAKQAATGASDSAAAPRAGFGRKPI